MVGRDRFELSTYGLFTSYILLSLSYLPDIPFHSTKHVCLIIRAPSTNKEMAPKDVLASTSFSDHCCPNCT